MALLSTPGTAAPRPGDVRTAAGLHERDLLDLAERRILAVRIPAFTSRAAAGELARRILASPHQTRYAVAPSVAKVGTTFFETADDPAARARYHQAGARGESLLRDSCGGLREPIAVLRERMRAFPAGVRTESVDGRPMSAGVARVFGPGSEIRAHQDVLAHDAPDARTPRELVSQLAVNVYVSVARLGGELALWRDSLSPAEYRARSIPGSPDLDERLLPAPAAVLRPRLGELIAFNCTCVHAVRPVRQGCRVAFATFVGYRGPGRPWSVWS
ncbi:MAG TPA: 2OG-Fe(II) oxygenase [Longimicrobium sp.]|nr:2OG-Fe(II) oxygenase [Longimicrobium sp.]